MSSAEMPVELPTLIDRWIAEGERGEHVYLSEVRRTFESHPDAIPVRLSLERADGAGAMTFGMRVPLSAAPGSARETFVLRYLESVIYNLISSYGGRSLTIYRGGGSARRGRAYSGDAAVRDTLEAWVALLSQRFDAERQRNERAGVGRALNVAERMADALTTGSATPCRFQFHYGGELPLPASANATNGPDDAGSGDSDLHTAEKLRRIPELVAGKRLVGIDVGGSNIKLVAVAEGRICGYKAYNWFPAHFTEVRELVEPLLLLARWGRARSAAACAAGTELKKSAIAALDAVSAADVPLEAVAQGIEEAEERIGSALLPLDAIGMCFPDVVVQDKVVGGEVYKSRGIRESLGSAYESAFERVSCINRELGELCCSEQAVSIINDGSMAAFTATVERALSGTAAVDEDIFAHTIGTELGSGLVNRYGEIPQIPLEVYNYIIDLGSRPACEHHPDDPRSTTNFNTRVNGTLQKYVSQSALFRVALKLFETERRELFEAILERGFVELTENGLRIPAEPKDMRGPFLKFLMALPHNESDETVREIFRTVGEYLGYACLETETLLQPHTRRRVLFGGLVRDALCFTLLQEGAARVDPRISLVPADDELAATALMCQLRDEERYPVAQFALAVGAVHYSCHRNAERQRLPGGTFAREFTPRVSHGRFAAS